MKIKKKRENSGEHYVKEPEVKILKWNGLRMLEREVVPEIPTTGFKLTGDKVLQAIRKKKNWSAPGPDLLANSCNM